MRGLCVRQQQMLAVSEALLRLKIIKTEQNLLFALPLLYCNGQDCWVKVGKSSEDDDDDVI